MLIKFLGTSKTHLNDVNVPNTSFARLSEKHQKINAMSESLKSDDERTCMIDPTSLSRYPKAN